MKRFSYSLTRKKISVRLSAPCLKAVDTLVVGVGTPQSCGLRKTALEFVRQDEPTDAGALGTRECVLFARVMELVDVPDSKSGGFGRAGSSPALGTRRSNMAFCFIKKFSFTY